MSSWRETHYAVVTDNVDPEKRGRLKVKCRTLVSGEGDLPDWIEPMLEFVGQGGAMIFVPPVKSVVRLHLEAHSTLDATPGAITLEAPDLRWDDCILDTKTNTMPELFKTNYPERRGFVTPAGHAVFVDDTESKIYVHHKDGAEMVLEGSKLTVTVATIEMNGDTVKIGTGADASIVRWPELKAWLEAITVPSPFGPLGPPLNNPVTPAAEATNGKVK